MEEIWKDIVIEKNGVIYDYTGLHQVSNMGRVRSLDRVGSDGRELKGKILKLTVDNTGYVFVALCKNGEKQQRFTVHRLVATMFIPNPDDLPIVNHKDEDKCNNNVDNLEWCTVQYNTQYSAKPRSEETKRKMSEAQKGDKNPMYGIASDKHPSARKVICLETKQIFGCIKDAQEWLGKGNVSKCVQGRSKSAGGYHWQYYEDYKKDLKNTPRNLLGL